MQSRHLNKKIKILPLAIINRDGFYIIGGRGELISIALSKHLNKIKSFLLF